MAPISSFAPNSALEVSFFHNLDIRLKSMGYSVAHLMFNIKVILKKEACKS
jgi:hypothetical protein